MTLKQYSEGIQALERVILYVTQNVMYGTAEKTTNNFEEFKEETEKNGFITVSKESCKNTIYSSAQMNVLARLFHDKIHLAFDLDFSPRNEEIVAGIQAGIIYTNALQLGYSEEVSTIASRIIYADIVAQAEYYQETGEFVAHQKSFIMNELLN